MAAARAIEVLPATAERWPDVVQVMDDSSYARKCWCAYWILPNREFRAGWGEANRRAHVGGVGMAVHDDFQGRGCGTALLAAVVDHADRWLTLTRLELTVWADNEPAIRLYQRHGFQREGVGQAYAYRDGQYVDALFMARLKG